MQGNNWYKNLKKSKLNPPGYVFKWVWPTLYLLMAIALTMVWTNKKCFPYCSAVTFFCIQLAFNLIWTTLFFKQKKPFLALLDIGVILLFTLLTYEKFLKVSKFAAYLLIPYIVWISFAGYLNLYIVLNN
jgi:tryptophan-rich sensory protein